MAANLMHIGFTGTRRGMTLAQYNAVLAGCRVRADKHGARNIVAHHGDCVGSDLNFHSIATELDLLTEGHPSTHNLRAFCTFDKVHDPKPPLVRNADIVAASDFMIATPYESVERESGGTWRTIKMTRLAKKPLVIVMPNGEAWKENWP